MAEETAVIKTSHDDEILKFVYTFEGHLKLLQNRLYSQWTEGEFCDLELQTFDGCIPVHAWLFACFSPKIATVLHENATRLNSKTPDSVFSMDILFTYDVVKAIVEAVYSGIFTATLEKLVDLQAAVEWLEMHEFVAVIKYIKNKAEKQNLVAHDEKLSITVGDSVKSEELKSLCNTNSPKSKPCSRKTADSQGPQPHSLVSLVKSMPNLKSHKKKRKRTLSDESKSHEILSVDENEEKPENTLLSEGIASNQVDLSNNNEDDHPEPSYGNSPEHSDEMESSAPKLLLCTENSGTPIDKQRRRSIRKKSTKPKKVNKTAGRPPQSSEIEASPANKHKSRRSSRSKKKPRKIDPNLFELALEDMSPDIESEEEKGRTVTDAVMTIGRNMVMVREELPDDTFEAFHREGMERAILCGDYKCDKCDSSFPSLDEYKNHVENHPTYTCEKCSVVYDSRKMFVRHVRGAHLKSIHLKCSECDFTAANEKELKQHCAKVHEESRPFRCLFEGCKFKTTKYRYLSNHFEHHEDKSLRTCKCEKCHKTFKRYDLLTSHRRSCYQVQTYLCDACGQSFNHLTSMKVHRRTMHYGEKPYSCKVCLKSFSNGANLRRHMRIHNNSFPYSCSVCMKQFRHSNTLKSHMSKHEKVVDTSPGTSQTQQNTKYSSNLASFHHQPNSCLSALNSSVQLCSIPSFTSSLPSVLPTMPSNEEGSQVFTMPPAMTLSSVPADKSFDLL